MLRRAAFDPVNITILYDNRSGREGMKTGWGFSC
ncbi:unnamed protein product, partial [marine sediment metagenome]